ncbi:MAG: glycosyltransferase family 4 protein [Cytophagaceae bacterium]
MRIAYLANIITNSYDSGGSVHASQIATRLLNRGHKLYTNLLSETDDFIKLNNEEFFTRGKEIEAFYIRIDSDPCKDRLTLFRRANYKAPCIWEINSPIEELRTKGIPDNQLDEYNKKRKRLAKMVDVAVCVSKEMEEYTRSFLQIQDTHVIPNGSDYHMFSPDNRDENLYDKSKFKVILAASAEYAWQGINIVKKLAAELLSIDRDILILVTSEGNSTENLWYLGHIPYSQMPRYLASADVGLCIYESIDFFNKFYFSPLKMFDYMASGLPVIGSDVGQIRSIIRENQNGLLTDNSIGDIIEKLIFLKKNRDLASRMGAKGREAVISKYNWDSVVSAIEGILGDVNSVKRRLRLIRISRFGTEYIKLRADDILGKTKRLLIP